MAKKKVKFWKYILYGGMIAGIIAFLYWGGLNLIEQYPEKFGGLALIAIVKLAKALGLDLSWLLKDEVKEKAGQAIITAQKKGLREGIKLGKEIAGWTKHKWAAAKLVKDTGCGKLKAHLVVKTVFIKTQKENPELFSKEKR